MVVKVVPSNDPRVFFAAERTLLAWIRTAVALIGLGFVVARFGLFLQLLERQGSAPTSHHVSPWIGVALALLGAATAATSSWQHARFRRSLGPDDLPPGYRTGAALAIGMGVSMAGLVLAAVLVS